MYKIRPLVWQMNEDGDYVFATTPFGYKGKLTIFKEDGLWWVNWDLNIPGFISLAGQQHRGQEFHDNELLKYLFLD